jgi:NOL1/NOP2/sun family putative RNA methylase
MTEKKIYKYNPKPNLKEKLDRIMIANKLDESEREEFWKIVHTSPQNSIRCNTLKISPQILKERLEKKGWNIEQPYKKFPEIMIIKNELKPGEIGKAREHLLGYYYVQEISSMLPLLCLIPKKHECFLDLCASPGSKTTQAGAMMENKGTIIANDNNLGRIIVLSSNLERCGISNVLVTKRDGVQLCRKLKERGMMFDKILVDAPCSGEGTLRSSPTTFLSWNEKTPINLASQQKLLASSAFELLKEGGEMIYSTCTHSPEENEEVVQFLIDNFSAELKNINLPLKTREGLTEWNEKKFSDKMKKCCRIYPNDNNTEGFFIAKITK